MNCLHSDPTLFTKGSFYLVCQGPNRGNVGYVAEYPSIIPNPETGTEYHLDVAFLHPGGMLGNDGLPYRLTRVSFTEGEYSDTCLVGYLRAAKTRHRFGHDPDTYLDHPEPYEDAV